MTTTRLLHYHYLLIGMISLSIMHVRAFAPTNFHRPYDVNFRTERWPIGKKRYHHLKIGTQFEYGRANRGRNFDSDRDNALAIYNVSESAITMLQGAAEGSDAHQLANSLAPFLATAADDGKRGRFRVTGSYEEISYTFFGQYHFDLGDAIPGQFDFSLYVPFRHRRFRKVQWEDLTQNFLAADVVVKQQLTSKIDQLARDLGDGLDLRQWRNEGIGDVTFMLRWFQDFRQYRKRIINVRLTTRLGLTLPTASVRDEDKALSFPLGYDGAVGVPFTVGLDVYFKNNFVVGGEFEAFKLFDTTRTFRMKTDRNQTDFLLLHKGRARKRFGMTWKFNLYVGGQKMYRGLSAKLIYQFLRHDQDRLYPKSNTFNEAIVNSAERLQNWTFQNVIVQFNYDLFEDSKLSAFKPQLMVFFKAPIAGRRVINPGTIGCQLVLNF